MTEDTWTSRDLPVLRAAVDLHEQSDGDDVSPGDIRRVTGFDKETVQRALRVIKSTPSFFEDMYTTANGDIYYIGAPTARARQLAGAWPSPDGLLENLIAALQTAADDDSREPEERSKLHKTALYLGSTATKIAIGALGGTGVNSLN